MHSREVPSTASSQLFLQKRTRSLTSEIAISTLVSPKHCKLTLKIPASKMRKVDSILIPASKYIAQQTIVNPLQSESETDTEVILHDPTPIESSSDFSSPLHSRPVNAALTEKENMNRSLTNLSWLCDLRLMPCCASRRPVPQILPSPPAIVEVSSNDDSFKRPNLSYAELICLAIDSSTKVGVSLGEIYAFICDTFPYYRITEPSWKV